MSSDHFSLRCLIEAEWQSNEFGDQWNSLVASSKELTIFSTWDWAVAWWNQYGQIYRSHVLAVYNKVGKLIGIAPLYFVSKRTLGVFPYREVHFIGDHSVGSEYLGFITAPGVESDVVESVMRYLACSRETQQLYQFSGLRCDSVADSTLINLVESLRGRLSRNVETCCKIALPRNYEEYLNTLSKNFRWNILYQTRRIHRDLGMRVIITEHEEQIDSHLERLFELHTSRWAKRKMPGSFLSENKRAFYRDVSHRFLKRGWLLFFHLELDGVIRACNYGFRYAGRFYELQTGYDVEFEQQYKGLGVVLKAHAIKHCIEEGLTTYDFLGGSEDFKKRWGTKTEITTTVKCYPSGGWAWLTYMGTDGIVKLKQYLKKVTVGETWDFEVFRWRILWSIRQRLTKQPRKIHDDKKPAERATGNSEITPEEDSRA